MKVQQYCLQLQTLPGDVAEVGQFVFERNESDVVIGFISSVGRAGHVVIAEVTLFEPRDLSDVPYIPGSEVEKVDWLKLFGELVPKFSKSVQEQWKAVMSR